MNSESVYANNNRIVVTTATVVTFIAFLMTFVFILLLLRRRRREKRRHRAETMTLDDHRGPRGMTVITEDESKSHSEAIDAAGHHDNPVATESEEISQANTAQQPTSSSAYGKYHFNIHDHHFADGENDVQRCEKVQVMVRAEASSHDIKAEYMAEIPATDSDSDYDATFETTAS